jgi:hypothetical protein
MPAYAPPTAVIDDRVRKRNTILAVVISAAILVLALFGLKAAGVLRLGSPGPDNNSLVARGQGNGSSLQLKGEGTPPSLASTRKTMPKNIRDWLEHLARIEKRKQALGGKQMEQMQELKGSLQGAGGLTSAEDVDKLTDPNYDSFPSIEKAASMIQELKPDWVKLKQDFDAYPPPPECQGIADEYDGGLQGISDTIDQVLGIVGGVDLTSTGDIKGSAEEVRGVGRNHRRGIDGSFEKADDLVQDVCDLYDTRKWFKIDAHGGSAGILGF